MKKILVLIFAFILCLAFAACDKKEEFNGSPDDIPKSPLSYTFIKS